MASASAAYLTDYPSPVVRKQPRQPFPFFSTAMMALGIVDFVLLFWLLNPFARPDASARLTPPSTEYTQEVSALHPAVKPSPVGAIQPVRRAVASRTGYRR